MLNEEKQKALEAAFGTDRKTVWKRLYYEVGRAGGKYAGRGNSNRIL